MKNRIDPELRETLEQFPPLTLEAQNMGLIRQMMAETNSLVEIPVSEHVKVTNRIIPGPEDNPSLRVRIYEPNEKKETLPGLLWIHRGGYVIGTANDNELLCQQFVTDAQCVVVSVDYRLAPEHPYPAPIEDCYSALKWFSENAEKLGVDSTRIGIAGASAGGGLTAALSLLARDRNGPQICFQMPLYPMIDDRNNTPSSHEITGNFVWNHDLNEAGWSMYLNGQNGTENVSPYAAPARATDLSGLPFTYTCVGQLDPFRDETLNYVSRLAQAGVDVEFHLYPGAYHGFESLSPNAQVSKRAVSEYVGAVKCGLYRGVLVNKA